MKLKTLSRKAQPPPPHPLRKVLPQANPQEANSRRTPTQEGVSTQSEPQENILEPQETGKNLDVRA